MTANSLEEIREWCSRRLTEKIIHDLDADQALTLDLYKEFAANGWLESLDVFGDSDAFRQLIEIGKLISGYSGALGNIIGVNCVCAMMLTVFGNDRQKGIGKKVLKGEVLACFSLTEPDAGSDLQNIKTTATKTDNEWVLHGRKYLATGAAVSDYILVVARTSCDKPLNKGMSLFLAPSKTKGIEIFPQEKIAANGYASCEIHFKSVGLSQDAIVGGQDSGWGVITFAGALERLMVAASCVGLSRTILEYLYEYAGQRIIYGQPLYEIPGINHQLVEMAIKIHAADLLLTDATNRLMAGKTPTFEICGAKLFASEIQQEVSFAAMKIIGGRGYLKAYPVERWMREGLLSLYAGGTNELQKNIMARHLRKRF